MLSGIAGRLLQPVAVAVAAAVVDIGGHMLHEFPQAVVLLDPYLHADGGSIGKQTVPTGLVFFPGMDIGVIPERHRLDALGAQWLDAAERAGGAAAVQQDLIHGCSSRSLGEIDTNQYITAKKKGEEKR